MIKRIVVYFFIFILIISVIGCSEKQNKETEEEKDYVPVEVEKTKSRTIYNQTTFTGKIYPKKEVMVTPKIPGRVKSVNVSVGDKIKKGRILFILDKESIEKQIQQSQMTLDQANKNYDMLRKEIDKSKVGLSGIKQQISSQYGQMQFNMFQQSLESAESQVSQAELGYNKAKNSLENAIVKAPMSGVVTSVNIGVNEMASNTQPAVTIIDMSKLLIEIDVSESMINSLHNGDKVNVNIPSADDYQSTATIDTISISPDMRTQLYPVKIYINNDDNEKIIKPGMFAQVTLNTDVRKDVLTVNSEAVLDEKGKSIIYVIKNGKAEERKVKIGLNTGEFIEIVSGIRKGEQVITKGQNYVKDGTKIKIVRGGK